MQARTKVPGAMHPSRVVVCGGTRLTPANAVFCERLGWELADEKNIVVITGGFKHYDDTPEVPSADWSVAKGLLARLKQNPKCGKPRERIITLLPGREVPHVVRFNAGEVVTLSERSARMRRFALVNMADLIVTVQGGEGTADIIELALTVDKACLPLAFTDGTSREKWHADPGAFHHWRDLDPEAVAAVDSANLQEASPNEVQQIARLVKRMLLRKLKRKCFVMMPFARQYDTLFEEAIEPAIAECGLEPIRTDRIEPLGNLIETIYTSINLSDCGIAVITGFRPNVLYEVGVAHGLGKPVILLCRETRGGHIPRSVPFDLKNESIIGYGDDMRALRQRIIQVLRKTISA